MILNRVTSYLEDHDVPFTLLPHRVDYTAQETAADTHTPGREFAKTVLLDLPGGHAMAVVPALHKIDLEKVRQSLGTRQVRLASEEAMSRLCPDCEVGAIPPFGNFYEMPVYVDPSLTRDEHITFNGGSHREAIRMRYADWERIVRPTILDLAIEG